jgi:signal transduction histidine kinase
MLDDLLSRLPVIVFAADTDGVCTYSEGSGLGALGLAGGQRVGVNLFEAHAGRDREIGFLRDALDGKSGSSTWRSGERAFDVWITPTRGADDEVDGLVGISVDVTDRVRARHDLELYRAFVDASPQFVALADLDGAVRYVNPGGRRMAEIPDDVDVTTTTIADYLTEEGLRRSIEVEQPAVVARGAYDGETTLRHWPTGRDIPVRVSSFLVNDHVSGEPRALATVQTDISAEIEVERETERRLSQQRSLLLHLHEAQETERRRIAHGVHDDTIQAVAAVGIRVQSALRLLKEGADPEPMLGGAVEAVAEASDRLRRMLVGLDVPDQLEQDLVVGLRDHLARVCRDEPFDCEVRGSVREPPPAHVSRVLFRIAQEALANVRTHAGAQRVVLEVGERDAGYMLSVRDDGRGMPPAMAVPARGRPAQVAGHMGLRSMAERAESLGGWCSVRGLEAAEGSGTLVEAWVPAWPDYSSRASGSGGTRSLSLLEQTMESISEGFAALDRDWRYVYVNQVGADLLRRHDLPGKVCWDEFAFSPGTEEAYRDAARLQRPTVARVHYADLGLWVESRVYPSQDGVSVFFRDVTAEHELEDEAAQRQRVITSGQALVADLVGEPDLEAALRVGLRGLREAWGLDVLDLEVEHPPGRTVRVTCGDRDTATMTTPVLLHGALIGSLRSSGTTFVLELGGLCALIALRVAASP